MQIAEQITCFPSNSTFVDRNQTSSVTGGRWKKPDEMLLLIFGLFAVGSCSAECW